MTELDVLVRRSLLHYPMLFKSRWSVLSNLFITIGNGYEWVDGRLVDVCGGYERSEDGARADFFRDLDDRAKDKWLNIQNVSGLEDFLEGQRRELRLDRLQRQFLFDHLDDVARSDGFEDHVDVGRTALMLCTSYSLLFSMPDDVEASFRGGCLHVTTRLLQAFFHYRGQPHIEPIYEALLAHKKATWPPTPAQQELARHMVEMLKGG